MKADNRTYAAALGNPSVGQTRVSKKLSDPTHLVFTSTSSTERVENDMAALAISANSWRTEQNSSYNPIMNLSEETCSSSSLDLMVLTLESDQICDRITQSDNGSELAEVIAMLDRILKDNQRYDPKIFSDWIL